MCRGGYRGYMRGRSESYGYPTGSGFLFAFICNSDLREPIT